MQPIYKTYNHVINGLAVGAGAAVSVAFFLIIIDVMMRLVGLNPPAFTIAIVEYILLYFTMFAAPWLVRVKGHVFIDAVTQMLPRGAQVVLGKIVYFLSICSALVLCYVSILLLIDAIATSDLDIRGIYIPKWVLLAPMPPCFLLVAVEFLRYLIGVDDMYGSRTDVRDSA